MTKLLRFQSLALVTGMGLFGLIAGCNPDEPAKPAAPAPAQRALSSPRHRPSRKSTAPAPVTPPKTESEKKKM